MPGGNNRVLYPASAKASTLLQKGLEARGFDVLRLNTYNTVRVRDLNSDKLAEATLAKVVAIASPSAIKAWTHHVGTETAEKIAVAAIGSTSANAAKELGLEKVYYPTEPGVKTFVDTIIVALNESS